MNKIIKQDKFQLTTIGDAKKLTKYILVNAQKINAIRSEMNAMKVADVQNWRRKQRLGECRLLANDIRDAEALLGDFLKTLPKKQGIRTSSDRWEDVPTKENAIKELGIKKHLAYSFETLADNKDIIEQVKADAEADDDLPTRTEVLRRVKEAEKDKRIKEEDSFRKCKVSGIDIRKGDFKNVLDDVTNIDAIITDPPYPKEFIQCFSDLSLFAKDHLKDDGFVAVYSGQYNLPEVIQRLSEHLTYVWTFCLYHSGKKQLVNGVNIMCGWKPVLIFSKGKKKMRFSAYDVLISEQREKASHEWQQSESGVKGLIEILSKPKDLIVDPFAGSGTFGKVSLELGRRFIGSEIK